MSDATAIFDFAATEACGVIGPNSVIQLGAALRDSLGVDAARQVFAMAGHLPLLDQPPTRMIAEQIPARLFSALWQTLPEEPARNIAREAGQRTARYILANRIPRIAHVVLRTLPHTIACRMLLGAIQKNAWTFAGSGICRTKPGNPALIEITDNPMRMPDCVWHQAVFAELFGTLITGRVEVRHPTCCKTGTAACQFEVAVLPANGK